MTIQELQTIVDSKPDLRELINVIVDYMQSNPGGGSQTLQQTLDNGSQLTQDNTVDLSGNSLVFNNGDIHMGGGNIVNLGAISIATSGGHIIMKSPDGNTWLITVDNSGALVVTADV